MTLALWAKRYDLLGRCMEKGGCARGPCFVLWWVGKLNPQIHQTAKDRQKLNSTEQQAQLAESFLRRTAVEICCKAASEKSPPVNHASR